MDLEFNADIERGTDLSGLFDDLVRADAARPVFFTADGEITRRAVTELADEVEERLSCDYLLPGHVVAVSAVNGSGFLASLLAIWRRSLVALLVDSDTPADRLAFTAASLGAAATLRCGRIRATPEDFELTSGTASQPVVQSDAAVIKLTSGSTGAPRGIVISPPAVWADTFSIEKAMGIGQGDRVVTAVPMSFSYGFGSLAIPALLAGRELIVPDHGSPLGNVTAARQFDATVLPTVPAFLTALLKRNAGWTLPESLRLVISAGAPLPAEVARQFRRRFGLPIHVFYGASECGGITYDAKGDAAERGTVGRPVPGVHIEIDEQTGLVEVQSPSVANGYLPPAPNLARGRFCTRDEAMWEEGELRLLGRQGSLINVGGHKINPREVEKVIAQLPGTDEVFVTALPAADGRAKTCVAVVESRHGGVSRQQVHDWCLAQMPAFKLPRRILVVREMPRNSRGKIELGTIRRMSRGEDYTT